MNKILLTFVLLALALTACGPDEEELARLSVERANANASAAIADARGAAEKARAAEAEADAAARIAETEAQRDQILALAQQNSAQDQYAYALFDRLLDTIRRQQDLALVSILSAAAIALVVVIVLLANFLLKSWRRGELKAPERIEQPKTVKYYLVIAPGGERIKVGPEQWPLLEDRVPSENVKVVW